MGQQQHMWTVDAIEEGTARIEVDSGSPRTLPAWILPADAKEGDVLSVSHDRQAGKSTLVIEVDRDATRQLRAQSGRQVKSAPPGGMGDIKL